MVPWLLGRVLQQVPERRDRDDDPVAEAQDRKIASARSSVGTGLTMPKHLPRLWHRDRRLLGREDGGQEGIDGALGR